MDKQMEGWMLEALANIDNTLDRLCHAVDGVTTAIITRDPQQSKEKDNV